MLAIVLNYNMANPRIIFIHGNGGSNAESVWIPETKVELEALGLEVVAHTMPDKILARSSKWLPYMQDVLGADENSILIGHSSGAVAAMRYAETHKIFGSVLVAAYHTDLGMVSERMSGYFDQPWDWDAIKANQNWIVQFTSADDPYIPIEEPRHIHQMLNTDYREKLYAGHFTEPVFLELTKVIKQELSLS
jgi:uncharacterized protein